MKKFMAFAFFVIASLMNAQNASAQALRQGRTDVRFDETSSVSTRGSAQDRAEGGILDRDVVLTAQVPPPAPWCYTLWGAYPMIVALPPGVFCQVNVNFPPYILTGVTGY
jgi:hypothetical protein